MRNDFPRHTIEMADLVHCSRQYTANQNGGKYDAAFTHFLWVLDGGNNPDFSQDVIIIVNI